MPLDLFANEFDAGQQRAMRETAPALPVPFDQAFEAAWNSGRLFSQSAAQANTNALVFDEALDETRQRTGVNVAAKISYDDPTRSPWDQLNDQIGELKAKRPDLDLDPYDDAEVRRRMVAKSRGALDDLAEVEGREKTFGGKLGSLLGGLAVGAGDPINLVAAPVVAPAGLGILGSALAWGAISGATTLASEVAGAGYREEVQPGYGAGAPGRVGEAVLFGAGTAGALHGLASAWTRVKTGAWPRSVRDAGNVVESEAQIAEGNRSPAMVTPEGDRVHTELPLSADGQIADEVGHREALATAVDQVLRGDPVDVGFDVWHGSPHEFDRFDISKIGTGEGAQSFGHGLYFGEARETAESYREQLSQPSRAELDAHQFLEEAGGDRAEALKQLRAAQEQVRADKAAANERAGGTLSPATLSTFDADLQRYAEAENFIHSGQGPTTGHLYRVKISADPEHFLDWDKPLSEQSARVQQAISEMFGGVTSREERPGVYYWLDRDGRKFAGGMDKPFDASEMTGSEIAKTAELLHINRKQAAAAMQQAGIPGIKYLDQGSRDVGQGTRNFVVFDDSLLDITHVNDVPVAKPEPARPEPPPVAAAPELRPEAMAETIASPQMTQALAADLERLTIGEKPTLVPVGIDQHGNEVMASLDSLLHDAQLDEEAAAQLEACAMPAAEAAE